MQTSSAADRWQEQSQHAPHQPPHDAGWAVTVPSFPWQAGSSSSCSLTTMSAFGQVLTRVRATPLTPGTLQPASRSTHRSQPRGGGLCAQVGAHKLSWEIKPCWPRVEPGGIKTGSVAKQAGVVLVSGGEPWAQSMVMVQAPLLTRLK